MQTLPREGKALSRGVYQAELEIAYDLEKLEAVYRPC